MSNWSQQVHFLASLHGRVVQLPPSGLASQCASLKHAQAQSRLSSIALPDTEDLRQRLAQVEAQVATLQSQLTDLALQLLREREQRTGYRLSADLAQFISTGDHTLVPLSGSASSVPDQPQMPPIACHPTEKRARLIPLIEYGAGGRYVLICPKQGELHITPHSPEWFAWLASLSSFRFVGKDGRFTARRGYSRGPNRSWYAKRGIHQKNGSQIYRTERTYHY
jgi:hypothetical protein